MTGYGAPATGFKDDGAAGNHELIAATASVTTLVQKLFVSITTPATTGTETVDFDDASTVLWSMSAKAEGTWELDFRDDEGAGINWGENKAVRMVVPTGAVVSARVVAVQRGG